MKITKPCIIVCDKGVLLLDQSDALLKLGEIATVFPDEDSAQAAIATTEDFDRQGPINRFENGWGEPRIVPISFEGVPG